MKNKSPQPIIHISTPHKKINNVCRFNRSPKQYSIPLNKKQEELYNYLNNNDDETNINNIIKIIDGPTGTGKTLFAIEYGIKMLMDDKADKIILINAEYNEYENPISRVTNIYTNAFNQSLLKYFTYKEIDKMISDKIIVNVSLYSLTGLTFDNAIIIADNMHYSSINQMKLLLTRIGYNTKMIICGNSLNEDINNLGFNDLVDKAIKYNILNYFLFDITDIVRNNIISQILTIYDTSQLTDISNEDIYNTNKVNSDELKIVNNITSIDIFQQNNTIYKQQHENDDWICTDGVVAEFIELCSD